MADVSDPALAEAYQEVRTDSNDTDWSVFSNPSSKPHLLQNAGLSTVTRVTPSKFKPRALVTSPPSSHTSRTTKPNSPSSVLPLVTQSPREPSLSSSPGAVRTLVPWSAPRCPSTRPPSRVYVHLNCSTFYHRWLTVVGRQGLRNWVTRHLPKRPRRERAVRQGQEGLWSWLLWKHQLTEELKFSTPQHRIKNTVTDTALFISSLDDYLELFLFCRRELLVADATRDCSQLSIQDHATTGRGHIVRPDVLLRHLTFCRGPSSSGKSLLSSHLASVLPNITIIRQDDYFMVNLFYPVFETSDLNNTAWSIDTNTSCVEWTTLGRAGSH